MTPFSAPFMNTFMVTWTVPDRPEFALVHPDRKAERCSEHEAKSMAEGLTRDGARNVAVIDTAKPWHWSADGRVRVQG
jgi:hypothetical protein